MSNTLLKQFQAFFNSLQDAYVQFTDDLPSETSEFNHVAVFPDCPVMWSADEDMLGTNPYSVSQSGSFDERATQSPNTSIVQYHYHYYSFSGFISSLVTAGAVCSGILFLLLVWVGLVKVQSTVGSISTVEDEPVYAGTELICEPESSLYI